MVEFSEDRHGKAIRKGLPIFVVSGGVGATGDLLARTVLAQFPDVDVPIIVEAIVVSEARVHEVIQKATGIPDAIILHTMVKRDLRRLLVLEAARAGIVTFDLAGPLEGHLSRELGDAATAKAGAVSPDAPRLLRPRGGNRVHRCA